MPVTHEWQELMVHLESQMLVQELLQQGLMAARQQAPKVVKMMDK